jgi:hypothetical protein
MRLKRGDWELGEGVLPCASLQDCKPLIYDEGSLAGNTRKWIRFKELEGGILDVYASNLVGERYVCHVE